MKQIIKMALKKTGITQKELAEKLFVTPQAVSKWVRGESEPTHDKVVAMSKIFGFEVAKELAMKDLKEEKNMENQINENTKTQEETTDSFDELPGYDEESAKKLKSLNSFEKAKKECSAILLKAGANKYSHGVYVLLEWLITATIGLTYHQALYNKLKYEEYYFEYMFDNLEDLFETDGISGRFAKNRLDNAFFLMGGDLFESFGDYKLKDHDYIHECMDYWYNFDKAYDYFDESDFNREFKIALLDIISQNRVYYGD